MSFSRTRKENLLHSMLEHGTHASEMITGTRPLCIVSNSRQDDTPIPRGHKTNLLRVITSAYRILNSLISDSENFCVRSIRTSFLPKLVKNSLNLTPEVALPRKLNKYRDPSQSGSL